MNEREALDRIAALCDRVQPGWEQVVSVEAVRGILAEMTREAPDAVNEEGQQTRDARDQEGVNCLVVRGPRLQFYRLFDTGTGEAWKPEIGGEPYQWRWYPADLARHEMHDEMSVWYRKGWEAALREGVTIPPEDFDLVAEAALWHASTLDRMLSDEDAKRLRTIAARLTRRA